MSVQIQPIFYLPKTALRNFIHLWFSGIWMILLPVDFPKFYMHILQYINQTNTILQSFVPWHTFFSKPKTKLQMCKEILQLQNRILGTNITEKHILDWYKQAVLSERLEILFGKETDALFEVREPPLNGPPCFRLKVGNIPVSITQFEDLEKVVMLKPNSVIFGPLLWIQLFLVSYYQFVENGDQKSFTYSLFNLLPCEVCRAHSLTYWTLFIEAPKKTLEEKKRETSATFLFERLLKLHNNIGQEHRKPPRTIKEISSFYTRLWNPHTQLSIHYQPNRFLLFHLNKF